ncbi:MAG: glutathione transferase GstA [Alphaproteobacteria bacterium]
MKLYYTPGACSLGPRICLLEAGLPFEGIAVNLKTHTVEATGADYYAIAPKGSTPALQLDNGELLTENPVMMQYIADQAGNKLAPAPGTMERYRLHEMLNYITSELHKGFWPLYNPATPESFRALVKDKLHGKFAYVDAVLAKTPYLIGQTLTPADAYLFNITLWADKPTVQLDLSKYHHLAAFMERMKARPSVQTAMKAEGLI